METLTKSEERTLARLRGLCKALARRADNGAPTKAYREDLLHFSTEILQIVIPMRCVTIPRVKR